MHLAVVADLDLAAHGYRVDFPDVLWSTLDGSGRALKFYADRARTAAEIGRFSERDAAVFDRLLSREASAGGPLMAQTSI